MKILYLILAHNQPQKVAELAMTLAQASTDAQVLIHFDATAAAEDYGRLASYVEQDPRVALTGRRVACQWGAYSLVDAVLSGLGEFEARGDHCDYVVLLSGACLPCRPIKQLERYLSENKGIEFIEAYDENWMIGGLRKERYEFYFPFAPSPRFSKKEHYFTQTQRFLRIKRKVPMGMQVRFGSQWWALTWSTCSSILQLMVENPAIETFFRKTYIPDEMMINTLVWHLVGPEHVSGFGLTHFQFTNHGKPIVFYDDHEGYPFTLQKFFYRKVSDEAHALRRRSLDQAFEIDNGEDLLEIGSVNKDYFVRVKAQTDFPVPGQVYYRDQYLDMRESVLRLDENPYLVVCGLEKDIAPLLSCLEGEPFQIVGRIFARGEVDWWGGAAKFQGLSRDEAAIRDLHPLLYLQRVRYRVTDRIPVFLWMPGDHKPPLDTVLYDPHACVISVPPMALRAVEARQLMALAKITSMKGVDGGRLRRAIRQMADVNTIPEGLTSGLERHFAHNMVTCPVSPSLGSLRSRAREIFEASLESCDYRYEPWWPVIESVLRKVFDYSQVEVVKK